MSLRNRYVSDVVFCVAVPGIYYKFVFMVGFQIDALSWLRVLDSNNSFIDEACHTPRLCNGYKTS